MLIKLYVKLSEGPTTEMHIIDNVSDVVCYDKVYSGRHKGPHMDSEFLRPQVHMDYGKFKEERMFQYIDYNQHGVACRLLVDNMAYVCNNEGKTIEKITV